MCEELILASNSPRRLALLTQAGYHVKAILPEEDVENDELDINDPSEYVKLLSRKKVLSVLKRISLDSVVVGADTVVYFEGKIYEKPRNEQEATNFLHEFSEKTHEVYTGVTLSFRGEMLSDVVKTEVTFRKLSKEEIDEYVRSGEPLDKAGAYGIQERGALLVQEIKGCYFNVVGLPLSRFYVMMKQMGDQFHEHGKNKGNVAR